LFHKINENEEELCCGTIEDLVETAPELYRYFVRNVYAPMPVNPYAATTKEQKRKIAALLMDNNTIFKFTFDGDAYVCAFHKDENDWERIYCRVQTNSMVMGSLREICQFVNVESHDSFSSAI
jgi:hypothetical protein